jgi:hypothetical protein
MAESDRMSSRTVTIATTCSDNPSSALRRNRRGRADSGPAISVVIVACIVLRLLLSSESNLSRGRAAALTKIAWRNRATGLNHSPMEAENPGVNPIGVR